MKIDLHVHSKYSEHPSDWFLQRLGAAESYTDPEFIYQSLKEKGMNFVTITDHNRINGALILKDKHPNDVIVGVEVTTYFPEDHCKIHVLVYGLNEEQFQQIQKFRSNIYDLRDYLKKENLAHAVAHATYSVNKKLKLEHLEKLLLLFDVFEGINGGRSFINNNSWMNVLDNITPEMMEELEKKHNIQPFSDKPWQKGLIAGSDDHAGLFMGTTFTEANVDTIEEFLQAIRTKRTIPRGRHNNYQFLAFTVYKIALDFGKNKSNYFSNSFFSEVIDHIYNNKKTISLKNRLKLMQLRKKKNRADDAFRYNFAELVYSLQKDKDLHLENRLEIAFSKISDIVDSFFQVLFQSLEKDVTNANLIKIIRNISSSIPGIFITLPFYTTIHHMFDNRDLLIQVQKKFQCYSEKKQKKILWFTDTIEDLNGVSATLSKVYEISKKENYDIKIVSLHSSWEDDDNYLNVPTLHTINLPYYEHLKLKFPSPLKAMEKIYQENPDEIIISTPGPIGLLGLLASRLLHIPSIGIYHTDFTMQTTEIKKDESLISLVHGFTHWFYQQLDKIYVPSVAYMDILEERGIVRSKMKIMPRGINFEHFYPMNFGRGQLIDQYNLKDGRILLYTGRISNDKNLSTVIEAFLDLVKMNPKLYFFLIGGGPYLGDFKEKYNHKNIIFTGKIDRDKLPLYYSGADLFVFPSTTDTFGMSVLEAQACGLPALVSANGGPKEIIEHMYTGYVIKDLKKEVWKEYIENVLEMIEDNPKKYLKMRFDARENVKSKCNWETFFNEFLHKAS